MSSVTGECEIHWWGGCKDTRSAFPERLRVAEDLRHMYGKDVGKALQMKSPSMVVRPLSDHDPTVALVTPSTAVSRR